MVMETREQAKSKAQAQNIMEDNKKKIPVVQAKMKLMNAQNKMKATLTQIKMRWKNSQPWRTLLTRRQQPTVSTSAGKG